MVRLVAGKPMNSPECVPWNPQPQGNFVVRSEEVLNVRTDVGKPGSHQLDALPPCLTSMQRLGQLGQVDNEVWGQPGHARLNVADVERFQGVAQQLDVRLWRGRLRGHPGFQSFWRLSVSADADKVTIRGLTT